MEEFINHIINQESKKTVGILLKRIELIIEQAKKDNKDCVSFKDLELIKAEQRELIYEAYRNLRDFILAGKIVWEFKQKKE